MFDENCEPDRDVEEAMRLSEIAERHAKEFWNLLTEIARFVQPMSVEYVEEMFRCAIEEAVGEGRQCPDPGIVPQLPYI